MKSSDNLIQLCRENILRRFSEKDICKKTDFALICDIFQGEPVASPGFFRGGGVGERSGHLKAITPPPRGGSGGEGPPDSSEVSFFKTNQSI